MLVKVSTSREWQLSTCSLYDRENIFVLLNIVCLSCYTKSETGKFKVNVILETRLAEKSDGVASTAPSTPSRSPPPSSPPPASPDSCHSRRTASTSTSRTAILLSWFSPAPDIYWHSMQSSKPLSLQGFYWKTHFDVLVFLFQTNTADINILFITKHIVQSMETYLQYFL